ncbi:MAG: hypothetical protein QOH28_3260 [Actinomycetota bacterium]|nr:hypothetical protein [Actinomycetota bacterium]
MTPGRMPGSGSVWIDGPASSDLPDAATGTTLHRRIERRERADERGQRDVIGGGTHRGTPVRSPLRPRPARDLSGAHRAAGSRPRERSRHRRRRSCPPCRGGGRRRSGSGRGARPAPRSPGDGQGRDRDRGHANDRRSSGARRARAHRGRAGGRSVEDGWGDRLRQDQPAALVCRQPGIQRPVRHDQQPVVGRARPGPTATPTQSRKQHFRDGPREHRVRRVRDERHGRRQDLKACLPRAC